MHGCLLLIGLLSQSIGIACTTTPTTSVIDTSCSVFTTIKASRKDTAGTVEQVVMHNRKWRALCEDPRDRW